MTAVFKNRDTLCHENCYATLSHDLAITQGINLLVST